MSVDRVFLDTNVLVYAHDHAEGAKHERAKELVKELWQSRTGIISTQVLLELASALRKKREQSRLREVIARYATWQVVIQPPPAILEALTLADDYKISLWDALIVQAAQSARASMLYTEDLSHGQMYGDVRVVNPFKEDQ